ncbi:MAG: SCP2 sterol-binding domain-containing protein [Spirochaetes bacterium]|nr:SCP2 sterol-binding domain-containing protein [Spirochaetota bacterium]
MAEYWGIKVEDIFNTMKDRFRPEGATGVSGSFGYDIAGEGKWKVSVYNGALAAVDKMENLSGCASVMLADGETFVGVNTGKVDATNAFMGGKIKVEGDMAAFGKTGKMFRKFVVKKKEMSTRDYIVDMFGTVESRFRADAAAGLDVIYGFDLGGPDGGKWSVFIKDGTCRLVEGIKGKTTVTVEMIDAKDYVDMILGKNDAQSLLAAGRGAAIGDLNLAMKWGEYFEKYADPMAGGEPEQELIVLKKTISVNQRFATGPVMGEFLNGLKEKKILANRCPKCGRMQLPPREMCAVCRVRTDEFVEVGPKGQVRYMEYVYYASPDPLTGETRDTPYGMVMVLLDGCKGNDIFMHLIRRDQIDKVRGGRNEKSGTRVRPVWNDKRVGSIFDINYFEIDE